MRVNFVIPGRIGGKGRPRFSRKTGTVYTPAKTISQEAVVRQFAALAMGGRELLSGPLSLHVAMFQNHPASWSKKRKASAFYVTGKPDADNLLKGLCDGMNGICFVDDSQIAIVDFERRYAQGAERVEVIIEELPIVISMVAA